MAWRRGYYEIALHARPAALSSDSDQCIQLRLRQTSLTMSRAASDASFALSAAAILILTLLAVRGMPSLALAADAGVVDKPMAELVAGTPALNHAENVLYGGETVEEDGDYTLADGATGVITIAEGVSARVFGCGIDAGSYTDLSFDVGDSAKLTICGVHVKMPTNLGTIPFIEFNGMGSFNIEGTNLVEMGEENNVTALHVVSGGNENGSHHRQ